MSSTIYGVGTVIGKTTNPQRNGNFNPRESLSRKNIASDLNYVEVLIRANIASDAMRNFQHRR